MNPHLPVYFKIVRLFEKNVGTGAIIPLPCRRQTIYAGARELKSIAADFIITHDSPHLTLSTNPVKAQIEFR